MKTRFRVSLAVAAVAATTMLAIAACDDDGVTTTPAVDSGTDTGAKDSGETPDTGADAAKPTSLFQRLGGEVGIGKFVDAVFVEIGKDPEIASFMVPNAMNPPPGGKPTTAQIRGCFILMIAAASADPAKGDPATYAYPGKMDPLTAGWTCRKMEDAHAALHISSGTFDKFAAIATGVAKAGGIADADLAAVDGFLKANKPKIVDPNAPDGSFYVFDAGSDAAQATDANDDGG